MKKNYKSILLFGFLLAALAIILQFFEYRYFIGSLNTNIYTSIVATIFTVIGIWIGINVLKTKKTPLQNNREINQQNLEQLNLNSREHEILELIAQGLTNQQIADRLFLALPTIKTHTSNLYSKLDVRNRTQAVHKAQSMNVI